jgi:hypothetical protein
LGEAIAVGFKREIQAKVAQKLLLTREMELFTTHSFGICAL